MDKEAVLGIISTYIERCKTTIKSFPEDDDRGVRIAAAGKILMLENIIRDIEKLNTQ